MTTRVYQLPFDGEWVIDIVEGQSAHTVATFPPGAAGLPYLNAFLRNYLNVKMPHP
jgi:hypothetical protein